MNKTKWSIKQLALLLSIVLIATVTAGGSLAYIFTQTQGLTNTFKPAEVTCQVNETFQDDVKSDVTIKNTGTAPAYIRAAIVVTWRDEQGNIGPETPVLGTDYVLKTPMDEDTSNDGWFKIDDYYYHKAPVAAEGEDEDDTKDVTKVLINRCKLKEGVTAPEGYGLSVEIVADAIQAEGVDADGKHPVELAWKVVTVDNNNLVAK